MAITDTPLDQLIINIGTKAQVDQAIREGRITEDMLTVVTDQDIYVVQVTEMPVASIDELGRNYQYVGPTTSDYTYGYFYKCVANGTNPETYSWEQFDVQPATELVWGNIEGDITNQTDLNTELTSLQDQIDSLSGRGRYLSVWNCTTGLAETIPTVDPYPYKTGDYFIVGTAVKAEPESCSMTIKEGSTVNVQFQQSMYKAKVGTSTDREDVFAYTTMRSSASVVYGDEKLVLADQNKFSELWNSLIDISNQDKQPAVPEITSISKIQFRWFYYSGTLFRACEIFGLDANNVEYQIYSNTLSSQVPGTFSYKEQQNLISQWLLETFGIGYVNDLYVPQSVSQQETWHAVQLSETELKWTLNGEDLPEGETITNYGLVPVLTQPVLGDIITIIYRTEKVNYKPNGSEYSPSTPSTVVETKEVEVDDTYVYDGLAWHLLKNNQKDLTFTNIVGSPYDNTNLADALNSKVSKVDTASQVYGTDENGNQTTYDMTTFGQIDNIAIHGVDQTVVSKRVDLSVVEQVNSLPTASQSLAGRVVQYTGGDTQDLVHNYFYECKPNYTDETIVVKSASTQLTASADLNKFAQSGLEYNTPYLYEKHGAYWDCIDPEGITISGPNAGLVTGGIVNSNDQVILQVDRELFWKQTNVQPETVLEWGNIGGTLSNQTDLQEALDAKQDTLTAGTNITIAEDSQTGNLVISSVAQETFFRGRWNSWTAVPTDVSLYPADIHDNHKPLVNDFMVVTDASGYQGDYDNLISITIRNTGGDAATPGYSYTFIENGSTIKTVNYPERSSGEVSEVIKEGMYITLKRGGYLECRINFYSDVEHTQPLQVKYNNNLVSSITSANISTSITEQIYYANLKPLEGSWRFYYDSNYSWDTDGKLGWKPQYQVEETLPDATDQEKGIAKLYTDLGENTDGAVDQATVTTELGKKQDTLTAGTGIDISTDASTGKLVISSTSSESFYRGTFATWNLVPTNPTNYVEDPIHHLKTPSNTDYMIVTDASDYYKPGAEITIQFKGYVGGTGYVLELSGEWSDTLIAYNTPYERVYGNNELIINFAVNDGAWSWRVRFNIPVVLNGTRYDAYDVWTGGSSTATRVFNEIVDQPCEGTWRFGYYGEWDTVGRNGWVAEYKIEDTLPIATDTVAGITKLYTTTGSNTDGTMDQNSITTELDTKATVSDLSTHTSDKNNPHEVTKAQVGLGNVDNTADLDKPISTATQSALDTKVEYAAKIITWTEVEE